VAAHVVDRIDLTVDIGQAQAFASVIDTEQPTGSEVAETGEFYEWFSHRAQIQFRVRYFSVF
jgi:hypothetical protein